jgi:hypothetical protein
MLKTHGVSPGRGIRAIAPTHRVVDVDWAKNDLDLVVLVLDDSLGLDYFARTLF